MTGPGAWPRRRRSRPRDGSRARRVAFVCQWYPPEPAELSESIATSLVESGLAVHVLTGVPNYPTGVVAKGYSVWRPSREVRQGVRIRRTPLYPSHDASAVGRLLNYGSWAASSALMGQRELRSADVALVYSSPATAALPAMVARRLWGTPYVLQVQDVWPDSIFASGFLAGAAGGFVHRALDAAVGLTYRWADHVAVTSPGMIGLLASRGVPLDKLSVVHNWVQDGSLIEADAPSTSRIRESWGVSADDFVLMYAGNHGQAQALEPVVETIAGLPREAGVHLVLIGAGVAKAGLVDLARGSGNVHFVDPVPRHEMPALMSASDAQLVSLADEPLFAVTMPSKVQSIMAAGLPLLVSGTGDCAGVVRSAGAGVTVSPGDRQGLRDAVLQLAGTSQGDRRQMGRRGHDWYDAHMSRRVGSEALRRLLVRAAERRRA